MSSEDLTAHIAAALPSGELVFTAAAKVPEQYSDDFVSGTIRVMSIDINERLTTQIKQLLARR